LAILLRSGLDYLFLEGARRSTASESQTMSVGSSTGSSLISPA